MLDTKPARMPDQQPISAGPGPAATDTQAQALAAVATMLDTHDDAAVLIDDDYRIVAANRAYREAYGVADRNIVGDKCHRISHHSTVPCHERGEDCPVRRVRETGVAVDTLHIHFSPTAKPERVRVRGYPLKVDGRDLLVERIERLDLPTARKAAAATRMIGESPAFLSTLHRLTRAAAMPGSVLITGESGVGKELAARFVHEQSANSKGPFIVADCAALPESLFEAEFFGHERGAFTGSVGTRIGLFEAADGGTLFLDEIGELPFAMQAKLLRAIDTGEVRRIGARHSKTVRARVVAATNRDPANMVSEGSFRLDLYYRLAAHEIRIPPLRERREDIAPIAQALLRELVPGRTRSLDEATRRGLASLPLPGNVRELRNRIERALGADGSMESEKLDLQLFDVEAQETDPTRANGVDDDRAYLGAFVRGIRASRASLTSAPANRPMSIGRAQLNLLAEAMARHDNHRGRVAAELGVSERTVYRWLKAAAAGACCVAKR